MFVTCSDIDNNLHEVSVSELTWRLSAHGIVIRDQKILLSRQFGKYDLPGGGIDLGESLEEGLFREFKEETGISVKSPRLLDVKSTLFQLPFSSQCVHSVLLYYICDFDGGELSTAGFDEDERKFATLAEWVDLSTIDSWQITSTVDFRPFVKIASLLPMV